MTGKTPVRPRSSAGRGLILILLAVAAVQMLVAWRTRPEPPPPPIDGVEVQLTSENFQQEVLDFDGFVLVDFWYSACPPCRQMDPVVAHLSVDYQPYVKVGRVDVERSPELTVPYEIEYFPTLLLFRNGQLLARWEGYGGLKETSRWLDEQMEAAGASAGQTAAGADGRTPSEPAV